MVFRSVYLCLFVFLISTSRSALSSFSKASVPESSQPLFRLPGYLNFARGSCLCIVTYWPTVNVIFLSLSIVILLLTLKNWHHKNAIMAVDTMKPGRHVLELDCFLSAFLPNTYRLEGSVALVFLYFCKRYYSPLFPLFNCVSCPQLKFFPADDA